MYKFKILLKKGPIVPSGTNHLQLLPCFGNKHLNALNSLSSYNVKCNICKLLLNIEFSTF